MLQTYAENEQLLARAAGGDKAAQDELVRANMGLVWSAVHRFSGRGHEKEDLFQVGCVGLIKAVKRFDAAFNVKFSTYAVPMILGEIKRFLRDDGALKVSRSVKELGLRLRHASARLAIKLAREPSIGELAAELGEAVEDVLLALEAQRPLESLSEPIGEGQMTLGDTLPQKENEAQRVEHIALKEALAHLSAKERALTVLRYFQGKTQSETAARLGMSQVQVSRLERKVLLKLRGDLEDSG